MPFFIVRIETFAAPPCFVTRLLEYPVHIFPSKEHVSERIQVSSARTVDARVRDPIRHRPRKMVVNSHSMGQGLSISLVLLASRARDTENPSLASASACFRLAGVIRFRVP